MLHILSLLVLFLAHANTDQEFSYPDGIINEKASRVPLLPDFRSIFEEINKDYNEDQMDWNDDLAELALTQSLTPTYDADLRIRWTTMFERGDKKTLGEKVRRAIEKLFQEKGDKVRKFSSGVLYGCNGFHVTINGELIVTTTCLYKREDLV